MWTARPRQSVRHQMHARVGISSGRDHAAAGPVALEKSIGREKHVFVMDLIENADANEAAGPFDDDACLGSNWPVSGTEKHHWTWHRDLPSLQQTRLSLFINLQAVSFDVIDLLPPEPAAVLLISPIFWHDYVSELVPRARSKIGRLWSMERKWLSRVKVSGVLAAAASAQLRSRPSYSVKTFQALRLPPLLPSGTSCYV